MRFLLAFISILSVSAWQQKDIIGTFKATGAGRHSFEEVHFGDDEVLVKRKPGLPTPNNLIRGHWYKHGEEAILEGTPQLADADVHFKFCTKDTFRYHGTTFVRAKAPTSLDTLAMVGHGWYDNVDKLSDFFQVLFTEGKTTLFQRVKDPKKKPEADPEIKAYHGDWSVKKYKSDLILGSFKDENNDEQDVSITIEKSSAGLEIHAESANGMKLSGSFKKRRAD